MGLGFQSISASGATPFWQSLAESSNALDEPLFAFQLTRFSNDTQTQQLEPGGTFTLGATNSSLFTGDIDYQDVPNGAPGYWIQELTGMSPSLERGPTTHVLAYFTGLTVNGQSITLPSGSGSWAAIDTGTTGIGCPADVLQAIFAAIPGSQKATGQLAGGGYYTYRKSHVL